MLMLVFTPALVCLREGAAPLCDGLATELTMFVCGRVFDWQF